MIARFVRFRPWVVMALSYAVVSIVILWPVLAAGPLHHTVLIEGDASFPVWANGWAAFALSHFRDPFFSPDVWAPRGVNLLANTTSAGLAVLFAPVTWVIGPIGAFNLQLITVPVVSALAMCVAMRPWVKSTFAVWLGGLAWGFCPLALESLSWGWTNFLYLATAPLLFWLASDLVHFKRHSPRFLGLAISAVITIQFAIGVEMLAMLAVVSVVVVVLFVAGALVVNRARVASHVERVARTAAWCAPILILVMLPLVLFTLSGPAHLPTWILGRGFLQFSRTHLSDLVSHPTDSGAFLAHVNIIYPSVNYFGYLLLAVTALVVVLLRRERLTWILVAFALFSYWLSLGQSGILHPWRLGLRLPVIHNIIVTRFIDLTWFPVIALIVLGFDRLVDVVKPRLRSVPVLPVMMIFPVLAFAQLGYALNESINIIPWGITADPALVTLAHESHDPLFVTFPIPLSARGMVQETADGFDYEIVGGWGPAVRQGTLAATTTYTYLGDETELGGTQLTSAQLTIVGHQLATWHVADVISPKYLTYPDDRGYSAPGSFIATMTEILGRPLTVDGEWVWPVAGRTLSDEPVSMHAWARCDLVVFLHHPDGMPACILNALAAPTS